MSAQACEHAVRLARRARYFCRESRRRGRHEVREVVGVLEGMGDVAIIGGMLRDLYLAGNSKFASDVDLVAHPESIGDFDALMQKWGAEQNRFGGYRLVLPRWKVDVWPLERTWASRAGFRDVNGFKDLLNITFFNWDAVLYLTKQNRILSRPEYFHELCHRALDVNLAPNPNPLGNTVRALRYARLWDARFRVALGEHVLRTLHDAGWNKILDEERRSYRQRYLNNVNLDDLHARLTVAVRCGETQPFRPFQLQHELPILPPREEKDIAQRSIAT